MNPNQFRLERYFFPVQEVRANPAHILGEESYTALTFQPNSINIEKRSDAIGVEVVIGIDEARSKNPPYFFNLTVFALISSVDGKLPHELQNAAATIGIQLLIGGLRERIAELTSRGPWPPLTVDIIPLVPATPKSPLSDEIESTT